MRKEQSIFVSGREEVIYVEFLVRYSTDSDLNDAMLNVEKQAQAFLSEEIGIVSREAKLTVQDPLPTIVFPRSARPNKEHIPEEFSTEIHKESYEDACFVEISDLPAFSIEVEEGSVAEIYFRREISAIVKKHHCSLKLIESCEKRTYYHTLVLLPEENTEEIIIARLNRNTGKWGYHKDAKNTLVTFQLDENLSEYIDIGLSLVVSEGVFISPNF